MPDNTSNDSRPIISWTPELLKRFKREYAAAPGDRNATFMFMIDGKAYEFLKAYAGYLIEYLDSQLGQAYMRRR